MTNFIYNYLEDREKIIRLNGRIFAIPFLEEALSLGVWLLFVMLFQWNSYRISKLENGSAKKIHEA